MDHKVLTAIDYYRRACECVARAIDNNVADSLPDLIDHRDAMENHLILVIRQYAIECEIRTLNAMKKKGGE
jgi:hypothetical protein